MVKWLTFLSIALVVHGVLTLKKPEAPKRAMAAAFAPPKGSEMFAFGYKQIFADLLWLRVVQNIDSCHPDDFITRIELSRPVNVPQEKLTIDTLLNAHRAPAKCHLGWVYQMLDRITDGDPRFLVAYVIGGTDLTVMVGDREGASRIFEKGLKVFPNDWVLSYRAAYHFLYEIGDAARAADLLVTAGRHGAPDWVFSLAAQIYSKSGQILLAKSVLEHTLATTKPGPAFDRLKQRLGEINELLGTVNRQPSNQ